MPVPDDGNAAVVMIIRACKLFDCSTKDFRDIDYHCYLWSCLLRYNVSVYALVMAALGRKQGMRVAIRFEEKGWEKRNSGNTILMKSVSNIW